MSTTPSWHEKLLGGFRRTSDRLVGNLAGLGGARLDDATLDEVEEALIASDLGPQTAGHIRARLAEGTGERAFYEAKLATARFFFARILPQATACFLAIKAGKATLMALPEDAF